MSTFRVCFSFGLKSVGRPLSTIFIFGVTFPCVCWVMASFMVLVNSRQILNLYLKIKLYSKQISNYLVARAIEVNQEKIRDDIV